MTDASLDAHQIASKGTKIYDRKYRAEFERQYNGQFAAIDIHSERAYRASDPDGALKKGKAGSPDGLFYLIRVGSSGAFKSSGLSNGAHRRRV